MSSLYAASSQTRNHAEKLGCRVRAGGLGSRRGRAHHGDRSRTRRRRSERRGARSTAGSQPRAERVRSSLLRRRRLVRAPGGGGAARARSRPSQDVSGRVRGAAGGLDSLPDCLNLVQPHRAEPLGTAQLLAAGPCPLLSGRARRAPCCCVLPPPPACRAQRRLPAAALTPATSLCCAGGRAAALGQAAAASWCWRRRG